MIGTCDKLNDKHDMHDKLGTFYFGNINGH